MADIKSGLPQNDILIASTDTTLLTAPTGKRYKVTFCSLHEQTGAGETVELFVSTDSSSASGERIDKLIFAENETKAPYSALVALPAGSYLIAKATTGDLVSATLAYTEYSGEQV